MPESTTWPELSIDDYAERTAEQKTWWEAQNGKQAGDPAKLANALLLITEQEQPPLRFIAGADAIELAEQKVADLQQQINAYRDLPHLWHTPTRPDPGSTTEGETPLRS